MTPDDRQYTSEHEWVRLDGDTAVVGITEFAQDQLGDVVYVELPEVGSAVTQGGGFGTIDSVKTASDLYAPVTGEVVAVNEALSETPEKVNSDPYGEGWMIRISPSDPGQLNSLMSAAEYEEYIRGL